MKEKLLLQDDEDDVTENAENLEEELTQAEADRRDLPHGERTRC